METINSYANIFLPAVSSEAEKKSESKKGALMMCFNEFFSLSSMETHKKQALLTILTAISAHIGENASLFLSTQPGVDGLYFMGAINKIIPAKLKRELSDINKRLLLDCPQLLKSKVVVAWNAETVKKSIPVLELLNSQGYVDDQIPTKGAGDQNINNIRIEGPMSLIVLIGKSEPKYLEGFSASRLTLESSPEYILEQLNKTTRGHDPRKEEILINIIKKEIERLENRPVEIPFLMQIIKSLDHTNPDSIEIMKKIQSLLKVVTIVNNAIFATEKEMQAGYYGISSDDPVLNDNRLIEYSGSLSNNSGAPLIATKEDYFMVYILIAGAFGFNADQISANAITVFNGIKEININFVFSSTALDQNKATERDIIKTLDSQEDGRGWADTLRIKEQIEKNGGVRSSNSTIHRSVKELKNMKFISEKKDPNASNKYLYAITTTTPVNNYDLPHPSDIIDPKYNGETVDVFNPLTGEMEYI